MTTRSSQLGWLGELYAIWNDVAGLRELGEAGVAAAIERAGDLSS
jgi:hypothetical protein